MATNRKALRTALADLLRNNVTSAQLVSKYEIEDPQQQSPVMWIESIDTPQSTRLTQSFTDEEFRFGIHVLVLYSDPNATPTPYVSLNSDDTKDDIEAQVRETLFSNWVSPNWQQLAHRGSSKQMNSNLGGKEYKHELIVVSIKP